MYKRFYDSRHLDGWLRLLPDHKVAEVTESKTEHGFTYWLVEVTDTRKVEKITLAKALETLQTLRAQKGNDNAFQGSFEGNPPRA